MRVAPEITPAELASSLEAGTEIHVLDVRAPGSVAAGRVDLGPPERFHNVPGSALVRLADPAEAGLPRDRRIAVVCGHGNDSLVVASHLNAAGFDSASLAGGMAAWMNLLVARELPAPPPLDRLLQFDRIGKGSLGYLVLCDGEALAVDPPLRCEPFVAAIAAAGARLVGVVDTHAHADYVSGGPVLARAHGAPYFLHAADAVSPFDGSPGRIAFEPAAEGREIACGRARFVVVHTPGHTEGEISLRFGDALAFTGDFLFVGSVGRPDLGGKVEAWTERLWESLERVRAEWPAGLLVYPAHYSSPGERNDDRSIGRAFGELAPGNDPFAQGDRERFREWVLSRAGEFPDAYRRIKGINLGLETPGPAELEALESGRNQCALG